MHMARDIARALDPSSIMLEAGFVPDQWQIDLLDSTHKRQLLLCSRQAGKSTATGTVALQTAMYEPNSLTLLISPAQRQSVELQRKVVELYSQLNDPPPIVAESALKLEFANGSRILALPGSEATIRGYSAASLIVVDEASRVEDALYEAVRPMLATTNGRFVGLSTPFGCRGWFHREWSEGQGWERTKVKATECPRISKEWLAQERQLIGEFAFNQEYLCEFVDTDSQFFSTQIIDGVFSSEVEPLWAT